LAALTIRQARRFELSCIRQRAKNQDMRGIFGAALHKKGAKKARIPLAKPL